MGLTCIVMGDSGAGKTTSLRNLDPASTFIIDADKKGLAWRGWRAEYSAGERNYKAVDDASMVMAILRNIDANAPHIKTVVVDTVNGIMVADEAKRRNEKNYDKWADLAWAVYDMFDYALTMRDDLVVYFLAHAQTDSDDYGNRFTHVKTSGRKLDKIALESKVRVVLHAQRDDAGDYVFGLSPNRSTAKTPLGAFVTDAIGNDLAAADAVLREYEGMEPIEYKENER